MTPSFRNTRLVSCVMTTPAARTASPDRVNGPFPRSASAATMKADPTSQTFQKSRHGCERTGRRSTSRHNSAWPCADARPPGPRLDETSRGLTTRQPPARTRAPRQPHSLDVVAGPGAWSEDFDSDELPVPVEAQDDRVE